MKFDSDSVVFHLAMAATVTCIALAAAPAYGGPGAGARIVLDCDLADDAMTLRFAAKTKGGGKPRPIASAGPVLLQVDQKIGKQYVRVSAAGMNYPTVELPVTAKFPLCGPNGSLVRDDATAIRGRASANFPGIGFTVKECSPKKPPRC